PFQKPPLLDLVISLGVLDHHLELRLIEDAAHLILGHSLLELRDGYLLRLLHGWFLIEQHVQEDPPTHEQRDEEDPDPRLRTLRIFFLLHLIDRREAFGAVRGSGAGGREGALTAEYLGRGDRGGDRGGIDDSRPRRRLEVGTERRGRGVPFVPVLCEGLHRDPIQRLRHVGCDGGGHRCVLTYVLVGDGDGGVSREGRFSGE